VPAAAARAALTPGVGPETGRRAPTRLSRLLGREASPGMRYMAMGAFWFSVMATMVKALGRGLPSQEIVLVRGLVNLLLSWGMVARAGISPWGTRRGLLLLRGIFGFLALTLFYASLTRLPLAESNLIQLSNPIYTALLAALILGERMGRRELACVGASILGVLLVVRPASLLGGAGGMPRGAVLLALLGALCSACAYIVIRKLTAENPLVVVLYFPLVTVPATLPMVWRRLIWPTPWQWVMLVAVGVTTQMAQVYLTRGLQREPAGRATAVGYLQVVFAALWGLIFFHEQPSVWTVAGAATILVSTVVLAGTGRQPAPQKVELAEA
jgi:drug/metabolite transporter (DMT)-like permease